MVDFGLQQGLSDFEPHGVAVSAIAGIVGYVEDFKRAKTPLRAKRCRLWMDTKIGGLLDGKMDERLSRKIDRQSSRKL
jgi:hypothetical protein